MHHERKGPSHCDFYWMKSVIRAATAFRNKANTMPRCRSEPLSQRGVDRCWMRIHQVGSGLHLLRPWQDHGEELAENQMAAS